MQRRRLFSISLTIFYWFWRLLGLCPFHYNSRKDAFNWTWLEILYSVLVWMNFAYFYPAGIWFFRVFDSLIVWSFFYFSLITITIVFAVQCVHVKPLTDLLNETIHLMRDLQPFTAKISTINAFRCGILFAFKTIFIGGTLQMVSVVFCINMSKMLTDQVDYFVIFLVLIAYFLQTIVPNIFYTFILGVSIQYQQLNAEIQNIADQATLLTKTNYGNKTQYSRSSLHFIELSNRLKHVASLHGKITMLTKKVNQVFSFQLLVLITNYVARLLIEVSTFRLVIRQLFIKYLIFFLRFSVICHIFVHH